MDKEELALALKGANEQVKEFFFSNMSQRAGKHAQGRHGGHGPRAPQGRRRGAGPHGRLAKDLAARGEIMITKNRGDEEMIY